MKKKLILISFLISLFISNNYAQINYEEGYFINNTNEKTNCFIKNLNWKNNPTEFNYKLSENSEIEKGNIETIKEFGITDEFKYKRFIVDIDRSSDLTKYVSSHKQPIFKKEKLFLNILVEGKANLYSYEGKNLNRYFYKLENKPIEQLVYKKYIVSENKVGKNNYYKQQLLNNLKCQNISKDRFEFIKYYKKELINLFNDFNNCGNSDYVKNTERKKGNVNITIRPGVSISSLSFENNHRFWNGFNIDFEDNVNVKLGVELEYVLPFYRNKWAIIFEPSYNYYKSELYAYERQIDVDYKSIDFPIGIRHYLYLNDSDSKVFIDASLLLGKGFNSAIKLGLSETGAVARILYAERLKTGLSVSLGYKYKKYSLGINYNTASEILSNYHNWFSYYDRATVFIGYSIF